MRLHAIPILLAVVAGLSASTVQAATTGILTFRGQISAGTCNLAGGDVSRTITLPPVKISDFDGINWAGNHEFDISADCESDIRNVIFLFAGTPSAGNGGLFSSTGTSANTGLWLMHRTPSLPTIPANGSAAQRSITVATSSRKAVLPLTARYAATGLGAIRQGTLVSTLTVSITYN